MEKLAGRIRVGEIQGFGVVLYYENELLLLLLGLMELLGLVKVRLRFLDNRWGGVACLMKVGDGDLNSERSF